MREEILKLVALKISLSRKEQAVIQNYPQLLENVLALELQQETTRMIELLENEQVDFSAAFKELCKARATRNQNTCIDFFHMPQGLCNQLYFEIAMALFKPGTLCQLLSILLPHICAVFSINYSLLKNRTFSMELQKEPADTMIEPIDEDFSLTRLSEIICVDDSLFDLQEINSYVSHKNRFKESPFKLHQKFHAQLLQHPELFKKLSRHNTAFKQLTTDLNLAGSQYVPWHIIKEFSRSMILGGERITGEQIASAGASLAATEFLCWLDALPTQARKNILALESVVGNNEVISIKVVQQHLKELGCVETASKYLDTILNDRKNHAILFAPLNVSETELAMIEERYKTHLNLVIEPENIALPSALIQQSLTRIEIRGAESLILLFNFFPCSLYSELTKSIISSGKSQLIISKAMANFLNSDGFDATQKTAFIQSIIVNIDSLDSYKIVHFATKANLPELVQCMLSNGISLWDASLYKKSLFFQARENPAVLKVLLSHVTVSELYRYLIEDIEDYELKLLQYDQPPSLKLILNKLSENQDLLHQAVLAQDNASRNVFHLIEDEKILEIYLGVIRSDILLQGLMTVSDDEVTALNSIYQNIPNISFELIFKYLPKESFDTFIFADLNENEKVIHRVVEDDSALIKVKNMTQHDVFLSALNLKNKQDKTAFHYAVPYKDNLEILLDFFSNEEQQKIINSPDKSGNTLLHYAAKFPQTLAMLLEKMDNIYYILNHVLNRDEHSVLYLSFENQNSMQVILSYLTNKETIDLLDQSMGSNQNILYYMTKDATITHEFLKHDAQTFFPIFMEKKILPGYHKTANDCLNTLKLLEFKDQVSLLTSLDERKISPFFYTICRDSNALDQFFSLIPSDWIRNEILHGKLTMHLQTTCGFADSFKKLISLFTPQEQKIFPFLKYSNGLTLLFLSAPYKSSFQIILELTPEEKRLAAFNSRSDKNGMNILFYAAPCHANFQQILASYPEEEKTLALLKTGLKGLNLMHMAYIDPDVVKLLISTYTTEQLLNMLKTVLDSIGSPLHVVVLNNRKYLEILMLCLNKIPENEQLPILLLEYNNQTLLELIVEKNMRSKQNNILQKVMRLLPQKDRWEACNLITKDKELLLFYAAKKCSKSFSHMFESLSADEQQKTLYIKYNAQCLVSSTVNENRAGVNSRMLIEKHCRVSLSNWRDQEENSLLHIALTKKSPEECLALLLASIDKDNLNKCLIIKNREGNTVLHLATDIDHIDFKTFMAMIELSTRNILLSEKNNAGETPLYRMIKLNPLKIWSHPVFEFMSQEILLSQIDPAMLELAACHNQLDNLLEKLDDKNKLKPVLALLKSNPETTEYLIPLMMDMLKIETILSATGEALEINCTHLQEFKDLLPEKFHGHPFYLSLLNMHDNLQAIKVILPHLMDPAYDSRTQSLLNDLKVILTKNTNNRIELQNWENQNASLIEELCKSKKSKKRSRSIFEEDHQQTPFREMLNQIQRITGYKVLYMDMILEAPDV